MKNVVNRVAVVRAGGALGQAIPGAKCGTAGPQRRPGRSTGGGANWWLQGACVQMCEGEAGRTDGALSCVAGWAACGPLRECEGAICRSIIVTREGVTEQ